MVRAVFLGSGVFIALFGSMLFLIDSVTLNPRLSSDRESLWSMATLDASGQPRIIDPPDWLPYTLVGMGCVTVLYAVALPRAAWKKD